MSPGRRSAAGGGAVVEIERDRLAGWVNRFAARNGGLADLAATPESVRLTGGDGTSASIAVPFAPMATTGKEPVEALLDHLAGLGTMGLILVRGGAHSVGIAKDGVVLESSTDRQYLQGRSAAGGWSQQRFARRRGNQLTLSLEHAAGLAARVLVPAADRLRVLVTGGDRAALDLVLADRRLAPLAALRGRIFADIPEPRRSVLDAVALRALGVEITVIAP